MYRSSAHYKDACEIGKLEYAASYRALLWWVMIRQRNVKISDKIMEAGFDNVILIGAGDLCDLFLNEIARTEIKLAGILEDNIKKYGNKYRKYNIFCLADVPSDFFDDKKFIIMYRDKFNFWAERLQKDGVKIDDIVSIEELLAYILYEERSK